MIETLDEQPRLILDARLEPTAGSTFQPTGFPDLGPAEFDRPTQPDGSTRALLVESVQSMANRFEDLAWDHPAQRPLDWLASLPYLEVKDPDGTFLSSSRLEPHRLAGAYVKDAMIGDQKVGEWMVERFGLKKGVPVDWGRVYEAIFELDPLCLIHGVFFSDPAWRDYGNPKVRRAISASIEAHDIRPAVSGGVKRDDVRPTVGEGTGAKEGYGFVPFGRTEYTAREIMLTASIDLEQIRGYGLSEQRTRLLTLLAAWEVASLLERPLRLRTACDLEAAGVTVRRPEDAGELPGAEELRSGIEALDPEVPEPGPRTVVWGG